MEYPHGHHILNAQEPYAYVCKEHGQTTEKSSHGNEVHKYLVQLIHDVENTRGKEEKKRGRWSDAYLSQLIHDVENMGRFGLIQNVMHTNVLVV